MKQFNSKQFESALNRVSASEDGKLVLAMLKEMCGWDMTYLSSDNPEATQYFATRRGIYGSLRQSVNPEYLKEIEFNYKYKVERHERPTSKHSTAGRTKSATSNTVK